MTTVDFKDAIKEMLEETGHYQNLKAQLQCIIFGKLVGSPKNVKQNVKNDDVELIDALVVEYLTWRGCHHACSVFQTEGRLGPERMRKDILRDLNIDDVDPSIKEIPVLLALIRNFQDNPN